ncbi:MAG: YtxH domain-containing protein [Chrysiogenales bacterium]|nr:MAG: YtxH domain-containing protein [Chrysiogenales bacterium]
MGGRSRSGPDSGMEGGQRRPRREKGGRMSDNNDGFKTFLAFLAGATIGAVFGALFAPKSGKEIRDDVREFADKLAGEAKAEYEKMSEKAKEMGDKAKRTADDAKGRFRKGGEEEPTA